MHIIHTDPQEQKIAAELAHEIYGALPIDSLEISCTNNADLSEAEMVLAVFSLKQGSFAPTVSCFRKLFDKKVAYLAILEGDVDKGRVQKTFWGIKKQFCGNNLVAAYICSAPTSGQWSIEEAELSKSINFAQRLLAEHGSESCCTAALAKAS